MALIGTIRNNFWFVLILLGLALVAFVLMDIMNSSQQGGARTLTMAEINGEPLDYNEFQRTESVYYRGSSDVYATRNSIYDFYIEKSLVDKESNSLGINVSKNELMDLQFGNNMSPIIQSNWRSPQTGQVDMTQLNGFKTALENGEEINPQFKAYWGEQEKHVIKQQKQDKLSAMVSKGLYAPNWMAEEVYKEDNTTVDFEYVKIPFSAMNTEVEVTDADIKNHLMENKAQFEKEEETRILDYVVFNVSPTAKDSAAVLTSAQNLRTKFETAESDSTFALANGGGYADYYFNEEQLPFAAKDEIKVLSNGEIYGPFLDQGVYSVVKMIDKRRVPDTVQARHILKRADRTNPTELASAREFIDSLATLINRGSERFDSLAVKHSDDGSAPTGGDLGKFVQGAMVPEFNAKCFYNNDSGLQVAVSQFGVHLIDVQDRIYGDNPTKYKIASVVVPLIPSEDTQRDVYDKAADLVSDYRDRESLEANLPAGATFESSQAVGANDYVVGSLGSGQTSRDMIKWAFKPSAELGDVSPEVYGYRDDVNYYDNKYVIATLKSVEEPGIPSAAAARSIVETAVANKLKAQKFAETLSVTDLATLATEYDVEVQTVADASSKVGFIEGIGAEPKVVSAAMNTQIQGVSSPIIGSSGVFVVKPMSKQQPDENPNLSITKQNLKRSATSQTAVKLLNALRKNANIDDQRATFF